MGMVSEMRLPGSGGEPGIRFNYRGMHRYLITLLGHPSCTALAERETVLPVLDGLRETGRAHRFEIYAYCFLPDRLVMLIRGRDETSDMKLFLAAFRAGSEATYGLRTGKRLWSKKYRERVLRKTEVTRAIAEEIFMLPVKAGLAPSKDRYAFQGSFVIAAVPPERVTRPSSHRGPRVSRAPRRPGGKASGGARKHGRSRPG